MSICRWTTATINAAVDTDLSTCKQVWMTIEDANGVEETLSKSDLTITENMVSGTLTQEQTGQLSGATVRVQIRALTADDKSIAGGVCIDLLDNVLKDGAITEGVES